MSILKVLGPFKFKILYCDKGSYSEPSLLDQKGKTSITFDPSVLSVGENMVKDSSNRPHIKII